MNIRRSNIATTTALRDNLGSVEPMPRRSDRTVPLAFVSPVRSQIRQVVDDIDGGRGAAERQELEKDGGHFLEISHLVGEQEWNEEQ